MLIRGLGWCPEVHGLLIKNPQLLITDRFLPEPSSKSTPQWSAWQICWEVSLTPRASVGTAGTRASRVREWVQEEGRREETGRGSWKTLRKGVPSALHWCYMMIQIIAHIYEKTVSSFRTGKVAYPFLVSYTTSLPPCSTTPASVCGCTSVSVIIHYHLSLPSSLISFWKRI